MAIFSQQYSEDFQKLLQEIKRYIALERRYWTLSVTEALAKLLGVCLLLVVCVLLGSIAVLALLCALTLWIGSLTGNLALGFLVTAAVAILLIWLIFRNQEQWIARPIARLVLKAIATNDDDAE